MLNGCKKRELFRPFVLHFQNKYNNKNRAFKGHQFKGCVKLQQYESTTVISVRERSMIPSRASSAPRS